MILEKRRRAQGGAEGSSIVRDNTTQTKNAESVYKAGENERKLQISEYWNKNIFDPKLGDPKFLQNCLTLQGLPKPSHQELWDVVVDGGIHVFIVLLT